MKILRYNARHCLWFPRGYDGHWLPQLNPISSCNRAPSGKRTIYLHEPLWAFRLRQRLFCFAGRHRCGRRGDAFAFQGRNGDSAADTWDIGPDGNRTCSYCGSIHPDDLMKICRKALADERYGVEGTTKSYKVYVKQPNVMNAGQGAIKFYMHHAPANPTSEDKELFAQALRITRERWEARYMRPVAAA